jgi:hypothetical protein
VVATLQKTRHQTVKIRETFVTVAKYGIEYLILFEFGWTVRERVIMNITGYLGLKKVIPLE